MIKRLLILTLILATACTPTNIQATPIADLPTSTNTQPSPIPDLPTSTSAPANTQTPATPPTEVPTQIPTGTFLDKKSPNHIRVLNYNINWDAIFPDDDPDNHTWREYNKAEAFQRIIQAIQPDIVCLQEINQDRDPADVSEIFDQALPLTNGSWNAVLARDNVILSPYPLLIDHYTFPQYQQAAALIDLPDNLYTPDLYMMCAHFKSAGGDSNISRRQQQADLIIDHIRDFRSPGDFIDLPTNTPFIMLGDFNVYDTDPAYHLTTLLTGDIINETQYGSDLSPDWDSTDLTDVLPSHNGLGKYFYTWRDDNSSFDPGPLDHIIYSDSVLQVSQAFILNTTWLSEEELTLLGLEANDVLLNPNTGYFDHFPMIVDFIIAAP